MTSTNEQSNHNTSELGGTSGEGLNPASHPTANGLASSESKLSQEARERDPPIPPTPPEPPDKKQKKEEEEEQKRQEINKKENLLKQPEGTGEHWFPPDILGSQIVIPSLKDLASQTTQGNSPNSMPESTDEGKTNISTIKTNHSREGEKRNLNLVNPEYGKETGSSERGRPLTKDNLDSEKSKKEKRRLARERAEAMKNMQIERMENFNRLFNGEGNWATYLHIKTETRMNITKMERSLLNTYASEEMMVRRGYKKECEYIVKTTCRAQSEAYLRIKRLNGQNVEVTKHSELNSIWGSIIIYDLEDNDEETYLDILRSRCRGYTVEEVKLINLKRREKQELNILKIKFKGDKLPEKIYLEGRVKEVRPFIPKPAQCYACLLYGHYKDKCDNNINRCFKCGSADHDPRISNCERSEKCFNCGGDHNARSDKCVFYSYYTQVKLLQIRSGLTIREAKIELKSKNVLDPYVKPAYNQTAKGNTRTPERPHERERRGRSNSIEENRYEALSQITSMEAEENPTETSGKRSREKTSPQPQRVANKKIKERSLSSDDIAAMRSTHAPQQKENTASEKTKEMAMEVETVQKSGDIRKIETVVNVQQNTQGFWADSEYEADQETQKFESSMSPRDDMQGIRKEIESYKKSMKEEKSKQNSEEMKNEEGRKMKKGNSSTELHKEGKEKKMTMIQHDERCSCETCMYRDVRELHYRNDRNISLVIEDYMAKPPLKDLKEHPRDCHCGAHMKQMIRGNKIPYSKIIGTIRENKFRPPKWGP